MVNIIEGVTHFNTEHTDVPLSEARYRQTLHSLIAWRTIFAELGLIGQDSMRYDGAGFGNISARCGPYPGSRGERPFLISGTQTGGSACLTSDSFALVERYRFRENAVTSRGMVRPSSESLTHGAIYDLGSHVRSVVHVHAPALWAEASGLGLPTTAAPVGYGTPEMAQEIGRLSRQSNLWERRVLVMAGHEDGVIAFGRTVQEASTALLSALAAAYALSAERKGGYCSGRRGP